MLTRSSQVAPQAEYYADSLLTKPTTSDTVFHNLAMGIATPFVALNMLDSEFSKKPEGKAILGAFDATRLENETPGLSTGQWLLGEGSNMLGFGLNPATWGLGEAGGLLARGVSAAARRVAPDAASVFMRQPIKNVLSEPLGRYIPEFIGKEGAEKPLSAALLTEKTLENFGIFAGAGIPQAIVNEYDRKTDHIKWGGVAREMGEMGAFGIAIGSIPFAWGVLRGKINRGLGKEPNEGVTTADLDQALEKGDITEAEHKWYLDYLEHQKDPANIALGEELKERGSQIINENGHTANTVSNEAMFEILTPDDVSNLQGIVADQLAGNVAQEYKTALSDFIVHNRLDYMRQNPKWLDGVRGYVDFINQKLEAKPSKLAEADRILDEHLLKSVKENMPFSQRELFKMMKKSGFEASHLEHLPVTIPENMSKHLKIAEKINHLSKKMKQAIRQGKPENKQTLKRIEELEKKLPKILTPKEELMNLKSALLDGGLKPGFERTNAYHRLVDLSHVWHNARSLLDRVHLESEYHRQEAFRDLAHQTLKVADSNTARIAKPDNVMDYLRRRIEGNLNKFEPLSEVKRVVEETEAVPPDAPEILSEQEAEIRKSQAEDAKQDFVNSSDRFKEFKESESVFKNLISCVLGGLGG